MRIIGGEFDQICRASSFSGARWVWNDYMSHWLRDLYPYLVAFGLSAFATRVLARHKSEARETEDGLKLA